jgi:hypothetical protein
MEQVIYKLKDVNFRLKYENVVLTQVVRIDTINKKDTVIVNYISIKNNLLKTESKLFRQSGCIYYRSISYFNKKELPEFIEYYEQPCLTKEDAEKNGVVFEKLLYWYERYEYDSKNRIITKVGWFPTVKARRFEYSYDNYGKSTIKFIKIKEERFWE